MRQFVTASVVVMVATIGTALGGAYAAMWLAATIDPTEGGWMAVFFVALPLGLLLGGAIGLVGALWLVGRRRRSDR